MRHLSELHHWRDYDWRDWQIELSGEWFVSDDSRAPTRSPFWQIWFMPLLWRWFVFRQQKTPQLSISIGPLRFMRYVR